MLKNSYHTHCQLCRHASGMPSEYIAKAVELGMNEIGISDHAHVPEEFLSEEAYQRYGLFRYMTLDEFENVYLKDIEIAKDKYKEQIVVYKGLETEYNPHFPKYYQYLKSKLDYLILGVHYFSDGKNFYSTFADVNYQNIKYYTDSVIKGIESGFFKICAHPDCFMESYTDENGNRCFDERAQEAARKIIECAIKNDVYLEINCQGIRKSLYKKYSEGYGYPSHDFWEYASKYNNLKIIIGGDSHSVDALDDEATYLVHEFVKKHKLNVQEKVEF